MAVEGFTDKSMLRLYWQKINYFKFANDNKDYDILNIYYDLIITMKNLMNLLQYLIRYIPVFAS